MCRVNKAISGGRNKSEKRQLKVSEARPLLEEGESERLINQDTVSPAQCLICLPLLLLHWAHLLMALGRNLPAALTAYTGLDLLMACSVESCLPWIQL